MFANPSKTSEFENKYHKKNNYSFSKSSKEKRNISPYLNNQNYSFSHQNKTNNDIYNYNNEQYNNNDKPTNQSYQNPLVFELLIKQKRKIQEELDEERLKNRKLEVKLSDINKRNKSLEKIHSNNVSFEHEQNKKYRNLKEKYKSLIEKKTECESEVANCRMQINEQNDLISHFQEEKQDLKKRLISKNKEYEKLYKEFFKINEDHGISVLKGNAEIEKLSLALKEIEKKFTKEKEINKNLDNYNSKLLEENELLIQEKINSKEKITELYNKITECQQKIEYLEKEIESKNFKLAKKRNKSSDLKEAIKNYQSLVERNKNDLIEIEEKNINLAEFIRNEIVTNKTGNYDASPTFKESHNTTLYANEDSKILNKSYENYLYNSIPKLEKEYNGGFNGNSLILESKSKKFKKYGKEAQNQFNLEAVKEKLSNIKSKKNLLEQRLRSVESHIDKI